MILDSSHTLLPDTLLTLPIASGPTLTLSLSPSSHNILVSSSHFASSPGKQEEIPVPLPHTTLIARPLLNLPGQASPYIISSASSTLTLIPGAAAVTLASEGVILSIPSDGSGIEISPIRQTAVAAATKIAAYAAASSYERPGTVLTLAKATITVSPLGLTSGQERWLINGQTITVPSTGSVTSVPGVGVVSAIMNGDRIVIDGKTITAPHTSAEAGSKETIRPGVSVSEGSWALSGRQGRWRFAFMMSLMALFLS